MADNATEINVQRDWDFSVNLSGLTAPTGKGGNMLPTGYYKVKLTDLYVNPERNANRVIIKVQVSDGTFAGAIRTTGFNKPTSDEDKVRYYWRGLAESAGYTPAQLDAGEVNLGLNTFQGKDAFILFTDIEDSEDGFENVDFLPPMAWSQQKQNFDMVGAAEKKVAPAAAGSALGTTEVKEATALGGETKSLGGGGGTNSLGGGDITSKSKLLSQLGMN
jgi:hypothetical protein